MHDDDLTREFIAVRRDEWDAVRAETDRAVVALGLASEAVAATNAVAEALRARCERAERVIEAVRRGVLVESVAHWCVARDPTGRTPAERYNTFDAAAAAYLGETP